MKLRGAESYFRLFHTKKMQVRMGSEAMDLRAPVSIGARPSGLRTQNQTTDISLSELEAAIDLQLLEIERGKTERRKVFEKIDEIVLAALGKDNRNFINTGIGGEIYRTLYDPGATLSLVGQTLASKFEDRLKASSTRVRTATCNNFMTLGFLLYDVLGSIARPKVNLPLFNFLNLPREFTSSRSTRKLLICLELLTSKG